MRGEIEQATKRIERYGKEPAQISTKQLAKVPMQVQTCFELNRDVRESFK